MLRPKKKMHRKEIKEDALVTHYLLARQWLDRRRKYVNIALTAAAAIVVLAVLMSRSKRSAEFEAEGKLGLAEQAVYAGDPARVLTEMNTVMDRFPGTWAARKASFFAAGAHFSQGRLDEAESAYRKALRGKVRLPQFAASSLAGLGAIEESRNRPEKAAEWYAKAGDEYDKLYTAPFHLKEAARCLRAAGKPEKAGKILDRILEKYPESAVFEEAKWMKESL